MSRESEYAQKQRESQEAEQNRQEHQKNVDAINAIADRLSENQKQQEISEEKKAFREKLTIGLLIATVLLTFFTLWDAHKTGETQHADSQEALDTASAALQQQREATNEALKRADTANGISQDTANRQLRAYLWLGVARSFPDFNSAGPITGILTIKNYGRTLAYNVKHVVGAGFAQFPAPEKTFIYPANRLPGTIVAPGSDIGVAFATPRPINQSERAQIISGSAAIYIFGKFEFDDAFAAHHKCDFRMIINQESIKSGVPWIFAPTGNSCDDQTK